MWMYSQQSYSQFRMQLQVWTPEVSPHFSAVTSRWNTRSCSECLCSAQTRSGAVARWYQKWRGMFGRQTWFWMLQWGGWWLPDELKSWHFTEILIQPSFFSLSPFKFRSSDFLLPLPYFLHFMFPRDLLSGAVWTKTVSFSDLINVSAIFSSCGWFPQLRNHCCLTFSGLSVKHHHLNSHDWLKLTGSHRTTCRLNFLKINVSVNCNLHTSPSLYELPHALNSQCCGQVLWMKSLSLFSFNCVNFCSSSPPA